MNKDTSQIRDILTLKQKLKEEKLSLKQHVLIVLSIVAMFILTYIFGYFTKWIEDINYTFIMTSAIFLLSYLVICIHLEYRYMAQLKTTYSPIFGLLPNLWAKVGPYVLALTAFIYYFNDLMGILVFVIFSLGMTALVIASFILRKDSNIKFNRFFMRSLALFVLMYLIFTLMQGMMISLAWGITLSIIILFDFIRIKIEEYYQTHNNLFEYFRLTAKPYFLILLIFSLFFQSFLSSKENSYLQVYRTNPIELIPKIKNTIDIEGSAFSIKFTELANNEFAITQTNHQGLKHHAIYNMDYEKIFEITLEGYDIVQGSPYVFRKITDISTPIKIYSYGILENLQSDMVFIDDLTSALISVTLEQILIQPSTSHFEIIKDGVTERIELWEGDQFEFQTYCDAFIRINGKYHYLTCQYARVVDGMGLNLFSRSDTYYHNGLIISTASNDIYFASDVNSINQSVQLDDIRGRLIRFNYDKKSILTYTLFSRFDQEKYQPDMVGCDPYIASRFDLKGRLQQRLVLCSSNMFIAHHDVFILRRGGVYDEPTWTIDVVDGYDMSYYAIKSNASILTYLFTPLFLIGFLFLNGVQFKPTPHMNKFDLFK